LRPLRRLPKLLIFSPKLSQRGRYRLNSGTAGHVEEFMP
jgi:hypothetical protein